MYQQYFHTHKCLHLDGLTAATGGIVKLGAYAFGGTGHHVGDLVYDPHSAFFTAEASKPMSNYHKAMINKNTKKQLRYPNCLCSGSF
jgi:hypothetical protein